MLSHYAISFCASMIEIDEDTIHPLVSAVTAAAPHSPPSTRARLRLWFRRCCFRLPNAALLILLWNALVGVTYGVILYGGLLVGLLNNNKLNYPLLYTSLIVIIMLSLLQFFLYPIGGLIADICCNRYRIVFLSAVKIWCGYGSLLFFVALSVISEDPFQINRHSNGKAITYLQTISIGLSAILFILGFTGFQANVVQFGLDQLLDAPSEQLSVFLHWFVWTNFVGKALLKLMVTLAPCAKIVPKIGGYSPFAFFMVIMLTMTLSCYKRGWFHREPCTQNPYGTVYRVLKFAATHNRPLRRSAFTYCDHEMPTRMDFAKQRFGGPFSTETVEDVKTFLRIVVMLLAIGPTYVTHVATIYIFPLYGVYSTSNPGMLLNHTACNLDWVLLSSGNLTDIVSAILLPLYIILILPCVRRYFPRILCRLGVGLTLLVASELSMTLTYLGGHFHDVVGATNGSELLCLFKTNFFHKDEDIVTLGLPSWVLVIPNILTGVAIPFISVTILEFISAQSPHTMKGVLLGVFYAIRGLFTLTGAVLVFPFAEWSKKQGLLDCGFSYYLFSVLLGVVGLVVFCVTARWYRYRVREDRPYGPEYVEEVFQRCIREREAIGDHDSNIPDYGTTTR